MKKRPKIKIELTTSDYFFEITGLIALIILVALPIYFFHDLPAQIPKHFNAMGEVDSYGDREIIWILPVIGLFVYVGLTLLGKIPYSFNYPVKVTDENAEKLYKLGVRTISVLKVVIILSFIFLNYKTISIALNCSTEIGKFFLPLLLIVFAVIIAIMIQKMRLINRKR